MAFPTGFTLRFDLLSLAPTLPRVVPLYPMHAMGIDVGGTNLRVGLIDSNGKLVLSFKEPTPTTSIEAFLTTLESLVEKVRRESGEKIESLGIGWPGAVDFKTGKVFETPNLKYFRQYELKSELERRLNMQCRVDNDAKCAALAEKKFGVAKNFHDFILLTFGTGIGGAIYTNGQLVRGKSGVAGEIGHMCLYPKGVECTCGSRGCFERYCSALALERRAEARFHKFTSARDILSQSETNREFQVLITEYVEDLALAIGTLVNIFDTQAFVFSGGLFTTGGQVILKEIHGHLGRQGFQSMKKGVQLIASELEGKAGIIGAASLML